jgi:hypothetical protein
MAEDSITSTSQEELGEHTTGPTSPKGEVFCPVLMRRYEKMKALEMKPSWRGILGNEGQHTKKILKTKAAKSKTCAPRRFGR